MGERELSQDDLGTYFMAPKKDRNSLSVAVVSGTELKDLQTANANQYFAGGSGFPYYVAFTSELPRIGVEAIKATGFLQKRLEPRRSGFLVNNCFLALELLISNHPR